MLKIISKKEYLRMKNEIESITNDNYKRITSLEVINLGLENQIEEILNRLKDMVHPSNAKMGRDKYRERIKDLIIFIQGKQR